MSEKKFDIYLEFNYSKLNLAVFNKINDKLEYYKEQTYESYFDNYTELDFEKLEKLIEENIVEVEKSIGEFVRDIYLIVETPQSISIKLSVKKNNDKIPKNQIPECCQMYESICKITKHRFVILVTFYHF